MALNLGSLVQTASGALNKKRELEQEAAERKRQQEMDVLQRSLMQARIDDLRTPKTPPTRFSPIQDPVTGEVRGYDPTSNTLSDPVGRVSPKPPSEGSNKPSEGQRRAGALTLVAEQAYQSLENAQPPSPADVAAGKVPFGIGNYWLSEDRKNELAAGSQLVSHYLYAISGATVTPQEAERQAKDILPAPNDGPESLANKAARRRMMIEAIRRLAGNEAPPSTLGPQTQQAPQAPSAAPTGGRKYDRFLK